MQSQLWTLQNQVSASCQLLWIGSSTHYTDRMTDKRKTPSEYNWTKKENGKSTGNKIDDQSTEPHLGRRHGPRWDQWTHCRVRASWIRIVIEKRASNEISGSTLKRVIPLKITQWASFRVLPLPSTNPWHQDTRNSSTAIEWQFKSVFQLSFNNRLYPEPHFLNGKKKIYFSFLCQEAKMEVFLSGTDVL